MICTHQSPTYNYSLTKGPRYSIIVDNVKHRKSARRAHKRWVAAFSSAAIAYVLVYGRDWGLNKSRTLDGGLSFAAELRAGGGEDRRCRMEEDRAAGSVLVEKVTGGEHVNVGGRSRRNNRARTWCGTKSQPALVVLSDLGECGSLNQLRAVLPFSEEA